jgi:hypothetical protein
MQNLTNPRPRARSLAEGSPGAGVRRRPVTAIPAASR